MLGRDDQAWRDLVAMSRTEKWVAVFLSGLGLIPLAVGALWVFMTLTAEPIHRDPTGVSSVPGAAVTDECKGAADEGRRIVSTGLAQQNLPGVSVAVGVNGQLVWAEGFGWADLEKRQSVSPDTTFRIGTASIALTSAGVGLLLEQGRLRLDDEIQAFVPEFPKKPWPVTLRQVMAHTAGIRSDGGDEGPLFSQHCDRPVDGLQAFADRDLRFEPGTAYRYSRFGYILVSAAIEAAAGEPFLMFMQNRIFDPLGMNDTRPDSLTEPIEGRATPYFPKFAADPKFGFHPMREIDLSCSAGSSVFLATPSDLVRFGMAVEGGTLLQRTTVDLLHTSQRVASGEETGYGLGWDLEAVSLGDRQARIVGHDGDVLGGVTGSIWTFPEHRIVVSVLANTSYADTPGLATAVARAFMRAGKPRRTKA
jgi:serine beta-lactamase-like protein LACTB